MAMSAPPVIARAWPRPPPPLDLVSLVILVRLGGRVAVHLPAGVRAFTTGVWDRG